MAFQDRSAILTRIGDALDSKVIAYSLGDRENLQTQVAADVLRLLPRHLEAVGRSHRLTLVLYTLGGDTNTPWPLVNFLRAYTKTLYAAVPFIAHSAGTLICLGADKIYMSRFGTLSPIDPSVTNAFNPQDPVNPMNRIPIAVEDVSAYFQLAREVGARDKTLSADAFRRLADSVHPLALGNVKRSIEQIRELAVKLIRLHQPSINDDALKKLTTSLTTELYSHGHLIGRSEAADLGLPVEVPSTDLEDALIAYYDQLKADLLLLDTFDPSTMLRGAPAGAGGQLQVSLERAYVETPTTCDAFTTSGMISQQAAQPQLIQGPGGMQIAPAPALPLVATLEVTSERWEQIA